MNLVYTNTCFHSLVSFDLLIEHDLYILAFKDGVNVTTDSPKIVFSKKRIGLPSGLRLWVYDFIVLCHCISVITVTNVVQLCCCIFQIPMKLSLEYTISLHNIE